MEFLYYYYHQSTTNPVRGMKWRRTLKRRARRKKRSELKRLGASDHK